MNKFFTQTQWLNHLRRGKAIYKFSELQRLTKLSEVATQRAVHRLSRSHLLAKLGKGYYANLLQPPLIEEVSAVLYPPCYISLESALFHHGIIEQASQMLTCVSTNKTKIFTTAFGEIYYAHVQPKLFFGYELNGRSLMALPEKAMLDFVYLQLQNGHAPTLDEWHWEEISTERLLEFSAKFPRTVQRHVRAALPEISNS
jgi:predicted transcriptional regulator of viral defense system